MGNLGWPMQSSVPVERLLPVIFKTHLLICFKIEKIMVKSEGYLYFYIVQFFNIENNTMRGGKWREQQTSSFEICSYLHGWILLTHPLADSV